MNEATASTVIVTPEQVWEAHLRNEQFRQMPENIMEVLRPFMESLPEVVTRAVEDLGNAASVEGVLTAKMAFLQHCMACGMARTMAETLGGDPGYHEALLQRAFNWLSEAWKELKGFLEQGVVTEEQFFLGQQLGMCEELKQKYVAGELTYADILLIQPEIISKNDQ